MIGLAATIGFIALNVLAAVLLGRLEYGSVREWWRS